MFFYIRKRGVKMSDYDRFMLTEIIISSIWLPLSILIMIDKKVGFFRRFLFLLICVISYIVIINISVNTLVVLILWPICGIAMYYLIDRRKRLFLLIPIAYIIVLNCNFLTSTLKRIIFGKESDIFYRWFGIPYCSVITVFIILFSFIIRGIIILARNKMETYFSKEMGVFTTFVIIVCSVACLIINWRNQQDTSPNRIYTHLLFASTIIAGIIMIGIFRFFYGRALKRRKEEEQKNIMEYTKHVEEMYEELRSFRHDYVNILASLSGYIENKDLEGLREYFEKNIMPTNDRMNQGKYRLQKLSKLQDTAIKGLISNKIIYAMNQGIDVFVDLMDEIKDISINTIDLCRVLGIYMDNAIEAASESDNKEIKFNVVKEDDSVTFVLMNSFVNHGLSLTDMEKQNVSSKGEGRGLGLNNVKEILSRYDNVNKITEIKDDFFIQTLIIDNKAA